MLGAMVVGLLLAAPGELRLPYIDRGACPFECCSYRQWTLNAPIRFHARPSAASPVVFSLKGGDDVQGITGFVITATPGRVRILKSTQLDREHPVNVAPGDILLTLHYIGEGYELFWFDGRVHSDQLDARTVEAEPAPGAAWQVLALPETDWWVKVRLENGRLGWTNETDKLDHIDACE